MEIVYMSRYIAAYDISHPSQRLRAAAILTEYGVRLQRSVFEVDLEPGDLPEIRRRIGGILAHNDHFDIVPIDVRPDRSRLAWQSPVETNDGIFFL